MSDNWRLLRTGYQRPALNMALDEALLEEVAAGRSLPILRLYRWRPSAVSLGFFQAVTDVDADTCRDLGLEVVRRPTGGRAVLHDAEATYAVIAREDADVFPGKVSGNYRVVAAALQRALKLLGLAAEQTPGRPRRPVQAGGPGNCFTVPSSWELVHRGCKVAGSAQKRAGGAFLQHGSIPVEIDLERLSRLLDPVALPAIGARKLEDRIGWLNRWCDPPVSVEQVENALIEAFAAEFGILFQQEEPTTAEWARAQALVGEKFGREEWVRGRQI